MSRIGLFGAIDRCTWQLGVLLLLVSLSRTAQAEVRLAEVFQSHMVLQRDAPLPIWGWAEPGEKISVSLGSLRGDAVADSRGRWECILPPSPLQPGPVTLEVSGSNRIVLEDCLMGDVWLCSGQSNMEWPVGACDRPEDIRNASDKEIRHFGVEMHFASTPQEDVRGKWQVCTPETVAGFTAVGYYFARTVRQEVGVPIGLVRSSVGGTNIELWMSQQTLMETPSLKSYGDLMRQSLAQHQIDLAASLDGVERWLTESKRATAEGQQIPLPPAIPDYPFGEKMFRPRCVTLYQGMIHPLFPMALRGVVWYQGENNAGSPEDGKMYFEKKLAMLTQWRGGFRNPNLPFYFVQLASWQQPADDPSDSSGWAHFRDAQRSCLKIAGTGMASALDIGDPLDIHPKNKWEVGRRLALWALRDLYGKPVQASGPLFREMRVEENRAVLDFDQVGRGLMVGRYDPVEGTKESREPLMRFAVAGEDRKWHWGIAEIDGDQVVVRHPEGLVPVAVRYAYSMNPEGANLYNRDGLPASPFRTDNW
jgi:sialate O-acetylesterase